MDVDAFRRAKSLFLDLVEAPPETRAARLSDLERDEPDVAARVRRMLDAETDGPGLVAIPGFDAADAADAAEEALDSLPDQPALEEQRIGPWRLRERLGAGGMGEVYLAERDDGAFEQQVAFKVVKRGMDTDEIVRRFHDERQTLANLVHPGVARLIDGGAMPDGRPYLVMERVEGEPIDAWARRTRATLEQRVRLLIDVCDAVAFAHRNLVVHRDLKPGNILVDEEGAPHLLDFGVARMLDAAGAGRAHTVEGAPRFLTPEYASPEQLRGEPVTTASDVYALGVILYELLCGAPPYRFPSRSLRDVERTVLETRPRAPSAAETGSDQVEALPEHTPRWRRRLRGDLDNIVLKSLRKEPERRYDSAAGLAEDLRNWLARRPVTARPDSALYRVHRFVQRNPIPMAAAVLLIATLIGATVVTSWQAAVARSQRDLAAHRFDDVRALANTFLFDFHDAIADLPGALPARRLVVETALEYLDTLAADAGDDDELLLEVAAAYMRVADVQGNPNDANLGDTAGAIESYKRGLRVARSIDPPTDESRVRIFHLLSRMGNALLASGDRDEARAAYEGALEMAEQRAAAAPNDPLAASHHAVSLEKIASIRMQDGDPQAAIDLYEREIDILEAAIERLPGNDELLWTLAVARLNLGDALGHPAYSNIEEHDAALEAYESSRREFERVARTSPDSSRAQRAVNIVYSKIGAVLAAAGREKEAMDNQRRALALAEEFVAADPENMAARRTLATALAETATLLTDRAEYAEALDLAERSLDVRRLIAASDPESAASIDALGIGCYRLGEINRAAASDERFDAPTRAEHLRSARRWFERCLEHVTRLERMNALVARNAGVPDQLRNMIIECDDALDALAPALGAESRDPTVPDP